MSCDELLKALKSAAAGPSWTHTSRNETAGQRYYFWMEFVIAKFAALV